MGRGVKVYYKDKEYEIKECRTYEEFLDEMKDKLDSEDFEEFYLAPFLFTNTGIIPEIILV